MDLFLNKGVLLCMIGLITILIIILIVTKPKKVKPINKTIDDVKNEKTEIEKVIEALECSKESRPMTTFEEEQEANAIISYQELVEAVKEKRALMEVENKKTESVEVLSKNLEVEVPAENLEVETIEVPEKPKFKNSEFISPIFGKAKDNDEFLKELKDFRSNL